MLWVSFGILINMKIVKAFYFLKNLKNMQTINLFLIKIK